MVVSVHCFTFAKEKNSMEIDYAKLSRAIQSKRIVTRGGIELKAPLRNIAFRIGISHTSVMNLEDGKKCDLETYALICRFLGVSMDTFRTDKTFLNKQV